MDIKKVIKSKGLTVKEVAARMGIAKENLSVHINGNPSVQVLERIADAVGCEVGDFFEKSSNAPLTCPHCGKKIGIKIEGC